MQTAEGHTGERGGERSGEQDAPVDLLHDAQRRIADLRYLSLCFFGFAFVRAWDDISFARFAALYPDSPWFGQDLMSLGMLPVFIVCVVAARKLAPLYRRRAVVIVAPVCMVASVLLYELAVASPGAAGSSASAAFPLVVASALLAGVGAALSILQWAELQACLNSLQIVLYVSGAFFLGSVIGWMTFGMGESRLVVALLVLPLLSFACLKVGFAKIPAVDLPKRTWGKLRFPWKLVIVLGVYEFVLGVKQGAPTFQNDLFIFGVMLASAILFIVSYFFSHKFDFTRVYRTPFVLMVCGLLATLLSFSSNSAVSDVLVSAGYALMFLMLTVLLCDLSHRYGVSAVLLCGIEELVMFASMGGHLVSAGMAEGIIPVLPDDAAVSVPLVILVVVASMVLLSEREYSRWGASFFGVGKLAQDGDEQGRFAARCTELGERYRLSPREKEVFQLLALGKSAADIERELYIANGTFKSHTRRIYQKLGIHSRAELDEMLRGE